MASGAKPMKAGKVLENFLKKVRHNVEYRIRFLHTLFVVWMFITLGWNISVISGKFPELRLIIEKDLETASWIFTVAAFGFLIGSFLFGLLFDRFNRLLLLSATNILNAVTIATFPWCSTFPTILVIAFINGFSNGGISTGGNSHIGTLWGQKAAPYMQTIHLGYSIGGILSPLSAEPFLAPKLCRTLQKNMSVNGNELESIANGTMECEDTYGQTHIHYAYFIAGAISLSSMIPFFTLYLLSNKMYTYVDTPIVSSSSDDQNKKILPVLSLSQTALLVFMLTLFLSMYITAEGRFAGLLTTFLVEYFHWPTAKSLHAASLFWGSFAAGRFLGIFVSRFVKTPTLLLACLCSLIVSMVGMFCAAKFQLSELVWASTSLAGISASVVVPSTFTWTAESILQLTGKLSAVYHVGMSVFDLSIPLLYGYMMDNFAQLYYIYLIGIQYITTLVLYFIVRMLIRRYTK